MSRSGSPRGTGPGSRSRRGCRRARARRSPWTGGRCRRPCGSSPGEAHATHCQSVHGRSRIRAGSRSSRRWLRARGAAPQDSQSEKEREDREAETRQREQRVVGGRRGERNREAERGEGAVGCSEAPPGDDGECARRGRGSEVLEAEPGGAAGRRRSRPENSRHQGLAGVVATRSSRRPGPPRLLRAARAARARAASRHAGRRRKPAACRCRATARAGRAARGRGRSRARRAPADGRERHARIASAGTRASPATLVSASEAGHRSGARKRPRSASRKAAIVSARYSDSL